MVKQQSRARDEAVTKLPILIPGAGKDPTPGLLPGTVTGVRGSAGEVLFQDGAATRIQPVAQFTRTAKPSKHFQAMAKLLSLSAGQAIDFSLLEDSFRTLLEHACGRPLADAVSKQAMQTPKKISERWLLPIFNREIKSAKLVMWRPPHGSPMPAIYCPDVQTAEFVNLLFFGVTACLGCGRIFTPHRPNQTYHDTLCAGRHRKRRERRRKAR